MTEKIECSLGGRLADFQVRGKIDYRGGGGVGLGALARAIAEILQPGLRRMQGRLEPGADLDACPSRPRQHLALVDHPERISQQRHAARLDGPAHGEPQPRKLAMIKRRQLRAMPDVFFELAIPRSPCRIWAGAMAVKYCFGIAPITSSMRAADGQAQRFSRR